MLLLSSTAVMGWGYIILLGIIWGCCGGVRTTSAFFIPRRSPHRQRRHFQSSASALQSVVVGPPTSSSSSFPQQVQTWLTSQNITHRILTSDDHSQFPHPQRQLDRISDHTTPTTSTSSSSIVLELTATGTTTTQSSRGVRLHLIPTPCTPSQVHSPQLLKTWTDEHQHFTHTPPHQQQQYSSSYNNNTSLIHLHQDIWDTTRRIVQARLLAHLGLVTRRIYARKTIVQRITNRTVTQQFLQQHHLWASTSSTKYTYGLFAPSNQNQKHKNDGTPTVTNTSPELLAVATFSQRRRVLRQGQVHNSHELVRYACRPDIRVVGGLSKLLRAFWKDQPTADDIVTLIDRNWSTTKASPTAWETVGFTSVGIMDPLVMVVPPMDSLRAYSGSSNGPRRIPLVGHSPLQGTAVWHALAQVSTADAALQTLFDHGYAPVYDAGVQRLVSFRDSAVSTETQALALWADSQPSYPHHYYSSNSGIAALLKRAAEG